MRRSALASMRWRDTTVYGPDLSTPLSGGTMDNPRADKVAVVDEVRERLTASDAAVLTEYRGLTVAELAALRRELAAAGGDYKIYKNTLVRLAVAEGPQAPFRDLLTGPTAIAFVKGDVSAVAKALRDFARGNPNLVVKGGMVGTGVLSASDMNVLADLPSRDTLMAQFAGALAAPLQQLAGLVQALPRNLAYGLSALIDQRQAGGEVLVEPAPTEPAAAVDAPEAGADVPTADAAPSDADAEPTAAVDAPPADAEDAGAAPDEAVPDTEATAAESPTE
jgi:large subunit ribosomal protein L10